MQHKPYNSPAAGNLGRAANPVKLDGEDLAVMKLQAMTAGELDDRRQLLGQLDIPLRSDGSIASAWTCYYQRAFDVLTSSKLVDALDVTQGTGSRCATAMAAARRSTWATGRRMWNDQLLMARRLVEAGARCVTVAYGFWDTHGGNFRHLKQASAAVRPGHLGPGRGHLRPRPGPRRDGGGLGRVRPDAEDQQGRRPRSLVARQRRSCAGGGMKTGQVIGSTDSHRGGGAKDEPIHYRDVLATVYQQLGIDPHFDGQGRRRSAQRRSCRGRCNRLRNWCERPGRFTPADETAGGSP